MALDRLLRTLQALQFAACVPEQTGYIVELVSYIYENTCSRFGNKEPMRRMVMRFIAMGFTKLISRSPDEIRVEITWCSFFCYTVAMRDFLCKVYDKLYCFLGYADMRLILEYESGGKRLC